MIGLVAHFARTLGRETTWRDLDAHARLDLEKFSITYIPREKNTEADALANKALKPVAPATKAERLPRP